MDRFAAVRRKASAPAFTKPRSEEHTSELQSHSDLVCRLLLEKKKMTVTPRTCYKNKTASAQTNAMRRRVFAWTSAARISASCEPSELPICVFFFNDTATTEIYTLSLHDALPISRAARDHEHLPARRHEPQAGSDRPDRKSTRLNSSHTVISYAVFCLKKKKGCFLFLLQSTTAQENSSPTRNQ